MRAMTIPQPGGPEALVLSDDVETPAIEPGSVLVKVHAAGINRADILQRQGHYDPPEGATKIPGLEVSGTIAEVGAEVTGWKTGDRVAALLSGGGYAEYVDVPAGQLLPVPDHVDLTAAAALPEVVSTVYSNVVMEAGLRADQWLLVHGGGSGIGTCAIQLARALGARVAVTVGSERKAAFCRELGADAVINYREEDFVDRIREITASDPATGPAGDPCTPGANVILDLIGAKYLERNIKALANDGRLVIIGMQGGVKTEINLARLLTGRKHILGTTLRARPAAQKALIVATVRQHIWPLVLDGTIRPIIHDTLPLPEAGRGHAMLEDGDSIGKVLLRVGDDAQPA